MFLSYVTKGSGSLYWTIDSASGQYFFDLVQTLHHDLYWSLSLIFKSILFCYLLKNKRGKMAKEHAISTDLKTNAIICVTMAD